MLRKNYRRTAKTSTVSCTESGALYRASGMGRPGCQGRGAIRKRCRLRFRSGITGAGRSLARVDRPGVGGSAGRRGDRHDVGSRVDRGGDGAPLDAVSAGALELVAHSADSTAVTGSSLSSTPVAALAVVAAPDSANRLISAGRSFSSMVFRKRSREHLTVMCGLTQGRRGWNSGAMAQRQQRDACLTSGGRA